MKAILKEIECMHHDPNNYCVKIEDIAINLSLTIGLEDNPGGDYFDLFVCSPQYLTKTGQCPKFMRHTLIVRKFDLSVITCAINQKIDQCTGNTWMEIAEKLSRYFAWEFEDYQH